MFLLPQAGGKLSQVRFVGSMTEECFAILQVLHSADLGGGCDVCSAITRISRKKKIWGQEKTDHGSVHLMLVVHA